LAKDISFHICFKAELLIKYLVGQWVTLDIKGLKALFIEFAAL